MSFKDHPARLKARAEGLTHFHSDIPCLRGHTGKRYVKTGGCLICHKEIQYGKTREWREKNPDWHAKHREANQEEIREQNAEYRAANRERIRQYNALYRQRTKDQRAAYEALRRARKLGQCTQRSAFCIHWEKIAYASRDILKELTGYDWEVDHIQPLASGGVHEALNLQVIPAMLNRKKGNTVTYSEPGEWLLEWQPLPPDALEVLLRLEKMKSAISLPP